MNVPNTEPLQEVFHPGERELQERLGVRERMSQLGPKVIRDHMPEQHRELFEKLPMLVIGALDEMSRPWVTLLTGRPGFINAPDPYRLEVTADSLPFDPVVGHIKSGSDIGVLGIEFETRRRNRMNAQVEHFDDGKLSLKVKQSFGNCPRYIQQRDHSWRESETGKASVRQFATFDEQSEKLLKTADSFFISSLYQDEADIPNRGVDVSHRGGLPGFIRVEDEKHLIFPDYSGNRFFNTLGNILLNPSAGLSLVDYETGDLLYLTGDAKIVWDDAAIREFTGAERLVRFRLDEGRLVTNAVPLRWRFLEYSPLLQK